MYMCKAKTLLTEHFDCLSVSQNFQRKEHIMIFSLILIFPINDRLPYISSLFGRIRLEFHLWWNFHVMNDNSMWDLPFPTCPTELSVKAQILSSITCTSAHTYMLCLKFSLIDMLHLNYVHVGLTTSNFDWSMSIQKVLLLLFHVESAWNGKGKQQKGSCSS